MIFIFRINLLSFINFAYLFGLFGVIIISYVKDVKQRQKYSKEEG